MELYAQTGEDIEIRHDPVLVDIFKKLGNRFDGYFSKIAITKIPKKYKDYYEISEYDGVINYTRYENDMMKKIVEDDTITAEKIDGLMFRTIF